MGKVLFYCVVSDGEYNYEALKEVLKKEDIFRWNGRTLPLESKNGTAGLEERFSWIGRTLPLESKNDSAGVMNECCEGGDECRSSDDL
ncbi:MAG: hypothetical protein J6K19_09710 [Prevotella sp.]|nr:hypothetical protein [Prevotella sp.]